MEPRSMYGTRICVQEIGRESECLGQTEVASVSLVVMGGIRKLVVNIVAWKLQRMEGQMVGRFQYYGCLEGLRRWWFVMLCRTGGAAMRG